MGGLKPLQPLPLRGPWICIHLQAEHIAAAKDRINRGVWHLQTADCRPQTADCRLQIADCKLKDTKNLPNKGETIKNITSCESEKVAWEQGWCFCAKLHWPHFQDAVGYSSPTRLFIDSPGILLIALILYSSLRFAMVCQGPRRGRGWRGFSPPTFLQEQK